MGSGTWTLTRVAHTLAPGVPGVEPGVEPGVLPVPGVEPGVLPVHGVLPAPGAWCTALDVLPWVYPSLCTPPCPLYS